MTSIVPKVPWSVKEKMRKRDEEKKRLEDFEGMKARAQAQRVPVPVLSPRSPVPITLKFQDSSLEKIFDSLAVASEYQEAAAADPVFALRLNNQSPRAQFLDPGAHTITLDAPATVPALDGFQTINSTAHYALTFERVKDITVVDGKHLNRLGQDFCKTHQVLPLRMAGSRLMLGVVKPDNLMIVDEVRHKLSLPIKPVVICRRDIAAILDGMKEEEEVPVEWIAAGSLDQALKFYASPSS